MTRTLTLLALAGALVALSGCPTPTADLIEGIQMEGATCAAGTTMPIEVLLNADAVDAEINWSVDGAYLSELHAAAVTFIALDEPGVATVTVEVITSAGVDTETAEVTVVGFGLESQVADLDLLLPTEDIPFNSVSFASPDVGWVVAGGEGYYDKPIIINYRDGTWTDQTQGAQGHMHAAWANSEDDFFATGGAGLTFHWDGDSWTEFFIPGGCVHGLSFLNPEDGWVTPAEGQPFMRRHTVGEAWDWESYTAPASYGMSGVSTVSDDFGFAVGNQGRVFEFDGDEWFDVDSSTDEDLHGIAMLSDIKGWAVGNRGTIVFWDGTSWEQVETPTDNDLYGIQVLNSQSVWAVGEGGTILFFGGDEWVELPSPTDATLKGLFLFDGASGWIVGQEGTVIELG